MSKDKSESLTGGSGVHVFLVLWKAARAVESYAEKSITDLEMCGSDFAVLEALLHKGPLPVNEIGKKILLTSGNVKTKFARDSYLVPKRSERFFDKLTGLKHLMTLDNCGHFPLEEPGLTQLETAVREFVAKVIG